MRYLVVALVLAVPALASAQKSTKTPKIAGSYEVAFKESGNTCENPPIDINKGTLRIEQSGKKVTVYYPMLAIMRGTVSDDGAFSARAKRGGTAIAGLQGEYAVAGSVKNGAIDSVVLVGRYFVKDKQYCEQSWEGKPAK